MGSPGGSKVANQEHLEALRRGVAYWNDWVAKQRLRGGQGTRHSGARIGTSSFWADLSGADLSGTDLYQGKPGAGWSGVDLIGADLRGARLRGTNLAWANLVGATLYQADLQDALLNNSNLQGSNLSGSNLSRANIAGCSLLMSNLRGARFEGAYLASTIFSDTDLTGATGLETCRHGGPSTIDYRTLTSYGLLPPSFLRACGLPDDFVRYILTLRSEFASCFISHSTRDVEFVEPLYADLKSAGVSCWLSREDLVPGARMLKEFQAAIARNDRLLVVCSEASIKSDWVADEVNRAFALESERGTEVVMPVRIDDSIFATDVDWAVKLRDSRHIGDFTSWGEQEAYRRSLDRLLDALRRPAS
jgi:uncharacterized protein YjbI with pentapeptide repeats